nr:hypothetical protein Iba_chr13cCG16720 [Ipomoea batatas]
MLTCKCWSRHKELQGPPQIPALVGGVLSSDGRNDTAHPLLGTYTSRIHSQHIH